MKRENRYLVIKRSDLKGAEKLLKPESWSAFELIEKLVNQIRANRGKGPLCCVVVEHDWPEYEPTWEAIEKRVGEGGAITPTELNGIRSILFAIDLKPRSSNYKFAYKELSKHISKSKKHLLNIIHPLEAKNKDLVEAIEEILELDGTAPDFDKSCKLIATMAVRRNK